MSDDQKSKNHSDKTFNYHIRIQGHLDKKWAEWFGNVEINDTENCETIINCLNVDQAELFRLLRKIHNLGLLLISVQLIFSEPNPSMESEDCK
jgi:hypothetical protein